MNFKGMPITPANLTRFNWKETEGPQGPCWMYDPAQDPDTTAFSQGGVRIYFEGTDPTIGVEDEYDYVHIADTFDGRILDMALVAAALLLHECIDEMKEV